jgi:hypothetical protein
MAPLRRANSHSRSSSGGPRHPPLRHRRLDRHRSPHTSGARDRQAAAAALDAALPMPFERTAVNGFGFLQIVRKRSRASLPELVQGDSVGAAARLLVRRAERTSGSGERTLHASPTVIGRVEQHPEWLELLAKRTGTRALLRAEPGLAISAGHVQSAFH